MSELFTSNDEIPYICMNFFTSKVRVSSTIDKKIVIFQVGWINGSMDQWPRKWGLISIMDINKFNEIYFQIIFFF